MIPTRSEYTGQAYRLFTDYNDIHVFVEDSGFENLYAEIFRRSRLNIRKVFSKTGKVSIIEAARYCNDPQCVYVIDRDWDDFLNIIHSLCNLVVLEKYSIENYFIAYSGFRALVLADKPRVDVERLLSSSTFNSIVEDTSNCLRPLFECYLAMQATQDSRSNCGLKPGKFQTRDSSCSPDTNVIGAFVANSGVTIPEAVRDYFAGNVLRERGHGKYMLHFVWERVRNASGVRQLNSDALLIRLAQTVDIEIFHSLCTRISNIARDLSPQPHAAETRTGRAADA